MKPYFINDYQAHGDSDRNHIFFKINHPGKSTYNVHKNIISNYLAYNLESIEQALVNYDPVSAKFKDIISYYDYPIRADAIKKIVIRSTARTYLDRLYIFEPERIESGWCIPAGSYYYSDTAQGEQGQPFVCGYFYTDEEGNIDFDRSMTNDDFMSAITSFYTDMKNYE